MPVLKSLTIDPAFKILMFGDNAAEWDLIVPSGTVTAKNTILIGSQASGGASFLAYTSEGNVDGGNNTGWVFTETDIQGYGPDYGDYLMYEDLDIVRIEVTPRNINLTPGAKATLTATGYSPDGTPSDITSLVTWASTHSNIASVASDAEVRGIAQGRAAITATLATGITGAALITVINAIQTATGSRIVAFAASNRDSRVMEYQTKQYKFPKTSVGVIKVVANKYPVIIDVIYPAIPVTFTISVRSDRPQRIPAALIDTLEIRARTDARISGIYLATSVPEIPL
jgi:hypothetical protein